MKRRLLTLSCWLAGIMPATAMAATTPLCGTRGAELGGDGRMLGHIRYPEAAAFDLISVPIASLPDKPCRMHRDAARDLTRMLIAARDAGVTGIRGISCFRSVERQREIFCGPVFSRGAAVADRARSVGPPGFSEHATGYGLDFGIRPQPRRCPDVEACIAATRGGRWLLDNATEYGFELSFPVGNAQRVTWEPWHWRWVGAGAEAEGAATARLLFTRARVQFAASPAVTTAPPVPVPVVIVPPPRIDVAPIEGLDAPPPIFSPHPRP